MAAPSELVEVRERARTLGFLGRGPVQPHIDHAAVLTERVTRVLGIGAADAIRALDLGSGGGLPGLVLAGELPKSTWVLLDASERRTTFLSWAVGRLGLEARVSVHRERAETAGRDDSLREGFRLVTARSFGPPAVTAECGAPFLVDGGVLAVSEPPDPDPTRWPVEGLALLGLRLEEAGSWALLRRRGALPDRYPRREGVPGKRPIW
jgi:16S rRNA (guanine527-N7)-methyltransferase